jgi:hypothetical protein
MRGLVSWRWGAGVLVLTAACFSSSSSPPRTTDFDAEPVDSTLPEAASDSSQGDVDAQPIDAGSPEAPSDSGCVPPQGTGCSFSVTGAGSGSGTCSAGRIFVSYLGTAQVGVGSAGDCTPLFFFTAVFTTPKVAPGTYTVASSMVQDTQSGWCPDGMICWREWQHPAPVVGSFTLTITSADDPPTDGGQGSVHGSVSATFPITTLNQTDAGTVSAQATF